MSALMDKCGTKYASTCLSETKTRLSDASSESRRAKISLNPSGRA